MIVMDFLVAYHKYKKEGSTERSLSSGVSIHVLVNPDSVTATQEMLKILIVFYNAKSFICS